MSLPTVRLRTGAKVAGATLALAALAVPSAFAVQLPISPAQNLTANNRVWDMYSNSSHVVQIEDGQLLAGSGRAASDGFDGGAIIEVDGVNFTDADDSGQVNGTTLATGPTTMDDLVVARADYATGYFLRTVVKLTNPGAATWRGTVSIYHNVGSDLDTSVLKTSSGDKVVTKADRWTVSRGLNGSSTDPVDTLVMWGPGAAVKPSAMPEVLSASNGLLQDDFTVSVPESATRYLVFFTEMNPSNYLALTSVKKYDAAPTKQMLAGLTTFQKNNTLNWNF